MEQNIKEYVWKRTIKYWGRQALVQVLFLWLFSFVYAVIRYLVAGNPNEMVFFVGYAAIVALIGELIFPLQNMVQAMPMVLSFGAGRREAFWGMQFGNLLRFIQQLLITAILTVVLCISRNVHFSVLEGIKIWATFSLGLFIALTLGQLFAYFSLCGYKKRIWILGGVIVAILFVVVIIWIVDTLMGFPSDYSAGEAQLVLLQKAFVPVVISSIVCVIGYVICAVLIRKKMMFYEVRG